MSVMSARWPISRRAAEHDSPSSSGSRFTVVLVQDPELIQEKSPSNLTAVRELKNMMKVGYLNLTG